LRNGNSLRTKKAFATVGNGSERLLAAAINLIASDGFEAASVREIAKSAGVSFALIRANFGSKEGLREAAEKAVFDEILPLWTYAGLLTSEEGMNVHAKKYSVALQHLNAYTSFVRRAIIEQRPIANEFIKQVLAHVKSYDAISESIDRRDAKSLVNPIYLLALKFGYFLIAPNVKSITDIDPFSVEEIERMNASEARLWQLVSKGLEAERREKANATRKRIGRP
jgi:AcrR family transcriptional regulator